jgi:hypothetical protein
MMTQREDKVLERLNALERQNRNFKRAGFAVVLVAACGALMAADNLRPKVLETEKLVLKDENGKVRGKIEASGKDGIVQVLMDDTGTERVRLSVNKQGVARIWVNDDDGTVRVAAYSFPSNDKDTPYRSGISVLGAGKETNNKPKEAIVLATYKDGEATQAVFDKKGKLRLSMGAMPDGLANLLFLNKDGEDKCAIQLGTIQQGGAFQQFFGKDGKRSLVMSAMPEGETAQYFLGADEKTRLYLGIYPNDVAGAAFMTKDGKPRMKLFTMPDGGATQAFYDKAGKERVSLNVFENGLVNQRVSDKDGNPRVIAYSAADGDAGQVFFGKDGTVVALQDAAAKPQTVTALKPAPGVKPGDRRRQIESEILDVERAIERNREAVEKYTKESADWDKVIRDGNEAMKRANTGGKQFLVGAAQGFAITAKVEAERKKSSAQSALNSSRDRLVRLRQELIRLRD